MSAKVQVDRALDVQRTVFRGAARIEDDDSRLACKANELVLGKPPRLAMRDRVARKTQVRSAVDVRIVISAAAVSRRDQEQYACSQYAHEGLRGWGVATVHNA
jgi:hypothetical protein